MRFNMYMMALMLSVLALVAAAPVQADFGIKAFDGHVTADPDGTVGFSQAGGHPYEISTSIQFNNSTHPVYGAPWPDEPVKDLIVDLPPGLIGNPTSLPKCTLEELSRVPAQCPVDSQVGTANVIGNVPQILYRQGVYNMVAPRDAPARFAINFRGTIVTLDAHVRTDSDYGVSIVAADASEGVPVVESDVTFWGVPADPRHDALRHCGDDYNTYGCSSGVPQRPFISLPTACTPNGVGLDTTLHVDSWFHPGDFKTATFTSHLPPGWYGSPGDIFLADPVPSTLWGPPQGPSGCDLVPFTPAFSAQPAQPARANAPAAFAFDLSMPQDADDTSATLAQGHLKKAVVTLPRGVRVSPSSADGLGACSLAQARLHTREDAACPDSAKIGDVTIDTPLLDDPLTGSIYLAAPHDNPSNTLLALYLVAKGAGVVVKLPGRVDADPVTGQLTATFDDNPQLPFSKLHLQFKDGPRSPLVNPPACGTYTTHAELTSWSGATKASDSSFTIDRGADGGACAPRGFAPKLAAGTATATAGASSPFTLTLSRDDTDQELSGVTVQLPTGLLATLKGIPRCPQSAITSSSANCPAASRIGSATVGAGAGPSPFYLADQPVYLTDGFNGAPFGLAVVTRAVAGPFDLGTVVVRQALNIDPIDAHVTVTSESLPTILQGIPLQIRDVRVAIDRPGFTRNPTSCAPKQIAATLTSTEGATADATQPYQAAGCATLPLAPKLAMSLSGKGQTTDNKHPAVTATLTQPAGDANLRRVSVKLPLSLALDSTWEQRNQLCEFVDGSKPIPDCKPNSVVGTATAVTPILDQPLTGPVYFVKNVRKDPKSGRSIRTLPKLVIPLQGENGLRLTLTGTSAVVDDHLVTTFDQIPDAPVSQFTLNIQGGAKSGVLVISDTDICKATQVADQQVDGQNSKSADAAVFLQTPACPLKVLSKKVGKRSVTMKVGGLGAGKVIVTGTGIKKATKAIVGSTVASLTVRRSKGRLGNVKVSFTPTGAKKAKTATATLR